MRGCGFGWNQPDGAVPFRHRKLWQQRGIAWRERGRKGLVREGWGDVWHGFSSLAGVVLSGVVLEVVAVAADGEEPAAWAVEGVDAAVGGLAAPLLHDVRVLVVMRADGDGGGPEVRQSG